MSRTQAWKKIPFNWLHSFFTWLFLYHKEVTKSLFQSVALCVTIFLQMKLATCNFTSNSNMQIGRMKFDTHRRDPFNQQFPEISVQTQWISSVQPEKFQKNWSTFWGGPLFWVRPVGILFEWIALSYRVTRSCSLWLDFFKCCFLLDAVKEKYSYISHTSLHFIYGWLRTCSPISSWLERIRNSLICSRIQ